MAKSKKNKGKKISTVQAMKVNQAQYREEIMKHLKLLCFLIEPTLKMDTLFNSIPKKAKDAVFYTRGTLHVRSGEVY